MLLEISRCQEQRVILCMLTGVFRDLHESKEGESDTLTGCWGHPGSKCEAVGLWIDFGHRTSRNY